MYRKPGFWVVLSLASAVCIFVALKYFGTAFPIINLDIQMDRKRALESGSELAKKSDWGPEDFKQAASFRSDEKAQVFVELEAGGSEAFNRVMAEHLYEFYTWRVRHFKENETNETLILFTPQGQPYGFVEKLPEEEPGTNVSAKEARSLAMKTSRDIWRIDPDAYELVEQAEKVNAGGRVDHTLIYERKGKEIGEGRYRLKLVIGGNKLTELTHFIKIPEGFTRRYQEMRSANKMVASISNVVVYVVYIFVGCVIGLFLLLRRNRVSWRKPLVWGLLIAFL
ncbi:MAG: hypothetical protein GY866_23315, partial [Proteobacteria bacterium]|nr:hypothetical protein [Pseudomonadota bacterium]